MRGAIACLVMFLVTTVAGPTTASKPAAMQTAAMQTTTVPQVDVYGDSLTLESEWWIVVSLVHRANVYLHVYGGTSICMWFPDMRKTAALHPTMVLITFAAWSRSCDHTTDPIREVQDDAGTAAQIFAGSQVVFASDPPVVFSTQQPQLDAAYRKAASLHRNARYNGADRSVAPQGILTEYLPCLAGETAAMGCAPVYGGVIKVRAPDGVHLCPVILPASGQCPMYSSGERRFGTAIAAPAVTAFPIRSGVSAAVDTGNPPG